MRIKTINKTKESATEEDLRSHFMNSTTEQEVICRKDQY